MTSPISLNCDLTHVYRTLRRAGFHPSSPQQLGPAGFAVILGKRDGSVIVSQAPFEGIEWIHASIAWSDRMPSYDDLSTLKAAVFGNRREAYQVFAPRARHVNIHAHALHLWGRADGARQLPDFDQFGTI